MSAHVKLVDGASITVDNGRALFGAPVGTLLVRLQVLSYYDRVVVACTPEQALNLGAALIAQARAVQAAEPRALTSESARKDVAC